ncbi:DUF2784 domain-containing protein [Nocardia vaccinii]|uniref:DUF2784 domain-containing protein n=1 Tax=Nocardia vaccinii TaxID=1822 RepID=UPI00083783D7|nr:DUF2784 domain-containing protein [Nocardia vaccinii]
MMYRLLADATAVVHFLFVVYVVIGGYLAWQWRWTIWTHLAAFGWGFGTVLFNLTCPLTHLENWARTQVGEAPLPPSGFIDHYITGVFYPRGALDLVRILVVIAVAISWAGYLWIPRHHRALKPSVH